jgi:hypothetical protein
MIIPMVMADWEEIQTSVCIEEIDNEAHSHKNELRQTYWLR